MELPGFLHKLVIKYLLIFIQVSSPDKHRLLQLIQHKNDPFHVHIIVQAGNEALEENQQQKGFNRGALAFWSPDLNPAEMLGHGLQRAIHTRHPRNPVELKHLWTEDGLKVLLTGVQV